MEITTHEFNVYVEELTKSLVKWIKDKTSSSTELPKLYFDGEGDSNQTKFEIMSNHLEIGVIASNNNIARVILLFLRMIVDKNHDFLGFQVQCYLEEGGKLQLPISDEFVEEFVNSLVENECYGCDFALDSKEISVTLRGWDAALGQCVDDIITKTISEVDIWTLPRIVEGLNNFLDFTL